MFCQRSKHTRRVAAGEAASDHDSVRLPQKPRPREKHEVQCCARTRRIRFDPCAMTQTKVNLSRISQTQCQILTGTEASEANEQAINTITEEDIKSRRSGQQILKETGRTQPLTNGLHRTATRNKEKNGAEYKNLL